MKKLILLVSLVTFGSNAMDLNSVVNTTEREEALNICEAVLVPDPIFEQALIDKGIDSDGLLNGQICKADAITINTLTLKDLGISDLRGIEAFANLQRLHCENNNLTVLDLSSNTKLSWLTCERNNITSLDLSNNPEMYVLSCSNFNDRLDLNLLNNVKLEYLNITGYLSNSLDITQNIALKHLLIWGAPNLDLDTSKNIDLIEVDVREGVKNFDFSKNLNLQRLNFQKAYCNELDLNLNSKLTELFLLQCYNLQKLSIKNGSNTILNLQSDQNSNLYCIEIDPFDNGINPRWGVDSHTQYSINCGLIVPGPVNSTSCSVYPIGPNRFLSMSWDGNVPYTSKFEVQVKTDIKTDNYTIPKTESYKTVPAPTNSYSWRVRPVGSSGHGVWSDWIPGTECASFGRNVNLELLGIASPVKLTETKSTSDIQLFPNPVDNNEAVTIRTIKNLVKVRIYNLHGKILFEERDSKVMKINTEKFKPGMYIVHLDFGENKKLSKTLIVR